MDRRLLARVFGRIQMAPASGCWEWVGTRNQRGYGRMVFNRSYQMAHRVTYQLFVGAIPIGLQLDHLCRNKRCVNPAHVEAVTHAENQARATRLALGNVCRRGHEMTANNTTPCGACRQCKQASDRIFDRKRGRTKALAEAIDDSGVVVTTSITIRRRKVG